MIDSPQSRRDRLAEDAEAYDAALQPGTMSQESNGSNDFETEHPELAKTVRLLNALFPANASLSPADIVRSQPPLEQIGRFRIGRFLGSGGFGSVWLGHDPLLRRDVAIKVAHVGVHASADLRERFQREAHLAARLHHPNIVPVFETDIDQDRLFIVSEFCPGQNLAEWLDQSDTPVEPMQAAQWVRSLADATDHAHRQGLIHRDINPANVLMAPAVTDDDRSSESPTVTPRLTDFGLARDLTAETSATRTGMLVGTAPYMSPEQASGDLKAQRPTTDIFSLGVLLYRLLTGRTPFAGQSDLETIQRVISVEPVAPQRCAANIPRDLSAISMKCIEKRPDQRYATAAQLRDDLDRFLRGESTVARPITSTERIVRWSKRSPAAATLVFVSILSALAILLGMGFHLRQVNRHALELSDALQETRVERELASRARDDAESARVVAEAQRARADAQHERARQSGYRSDMRLAFDLWDRRQIHQVNEILTRQQPGPEIDLRGPEWFALRDDVRATCREIGRHAGAVTECLLSADQRTVYSAGTDGEVRLWDRTSGRLQQTLQPKIGEIHALAISPDESSIAVGGKPSLFDRAHVVVINAISGERHRSYQSHATTIESIAYSPDGKWLAAGSRYEPVQLTRLTDGVNFTVPAGSRNRSLSFSSDSQLLSVTTKKNHVLWRIDGDQPEQQNNVKAYEARELTPYLSQFAPQQPLLATTQVHSQFVSVLEPSSSARRMIAKRDRDDSAQFSCLSFNEDGSILVAGDESGQISIWETAVDSVLVGDQNQELQISVSLPISVCMSHRSRVTSLTATSNRTVISGGEDGRVVETDPRANGATHLAWPGIQVNAFALDDTEMLLACEDGTVRKFPAIPTLPGSSERHATADRSERITAPAILIDGPSPIRAIALSPDRAFIAIGTVDGGVTTYDRQSREVVRRLVAPQPEAKDTAIRDLCFSSDGQWLAHTTDRGSVVVQEITTGQEKLNHLGVGTGWSVAFFANDRFVALGGRYERIRIFDLATGKLAKSVEGQNATSLAVSPDGKSLMSGHLDGTLQIMDMTADPRVRVILGHGAIVESLAHFPRGKILVSQDHEHSIQFTDVPTGTVFGRLKLIGVHENGAPKFFRMQCSDRLLAVIVGHVDGPRTDLYWWRIDDLPTR